MNFILNIVVFGAVFSVISTKQNDLITVFQVFRHGHRTPIEFYKNDPYADKKFWNGLDLGQLTEKGNRQTYKLGQQTGQRYKDFLPRRYNKTNFYARSTDVDRTLMSGQCFLYGLFPANGDQMWHKHSDWQPVPLHPADTRIFIGFPAPCPTYDNYYANAYSTEEFQILDQENKDLLEYISEHSGQNYDTVVSLWLLYDCLKVEQDAGFELPDWVSPVYERMRNLTGLLYQTMTKTIQAKRLYTGTFLNYVVSYFDEMAANASYSQKYQVFSGHDSNIAAILNSFGAFDPPYPPEFASSIWIELKQNDGFVYVNVWSKDGNDLKQINVNGCPLDCPLPQFKEKLSHILLDPDTLTNECNAV